MSTVCFLLVVVPACVAGFMAYQARKAAEARTEAELRAAQQGIALPPKQSAAAGVVGGVLKAAVEAAVKQALPKKPF